MIEHDVIYFWHSTALQVGGEYTKRVGNYDNSLERESTQRLGFILPLGERLGLGVEIVLANAWNKVSMADFSTMYTFESQDLAGFSMDNQSSGAYVGLGYRLMEGLSLGAAFQGSYTNDTPSSGHTIFEDNSKLNVSVDLGFLVQAWEERLLFDLHGVYTTQAETYYDGAAKDIEPGRLPLILAGTLTTAFFNKQLFLSLKGIGDIYPEDRSGYTIRAIPALEFWPFPFLAIRGGYEYAQMDISDRFKIGHGGFGGISLIFGKWEFNANFTYRNKPIHLLPGYSLDDMTMMLGVVKNDTFLRR